MTILFDQGTPVPLRDALVGHTVGTAYERGWSTLGNGELLDAPRRLTRRWLATFVTRDCLRLHSFSNPRPPA